MGVRTCANGDVELAYETIGTSGEPLLLLAPMGNESRLMFHEDFCAALVEAGFLVARFDNRDGGLSTHLAQGATYSLRDMAGDALAVLDALGWSSAHLFGVSLGGIIGQTCAVHNADRVRTLTTVATSPSTGWLVARPKLGTLPKILLLGKPADTSPEALGDYAVKLAKITGSTTYPIDEAWIRRIAGIYPADPAAALRHMAAFRSSGD
ncbi:MAG TPA: alpha/beta hydrolase, partial [Pseudonocardiaceae bacterium]